MPKLSELTDYSPEPEVTPSGRLYVSPNMPTSEDGDYFTKPVAPMPELGSNNVVERIIKKLAETEFSGGTDIGNKLAGTGGQERYQLWPEKIVRSALTAIPDAYSGKIPMHDVNPETGELEPSQAMIGRALDMASFAGVGGMGGTGEGGIALGAGPSLRPALKYKDRLYKGKEGQQHMDVIPPHLYPEFQDMAMKGEDISHYNFGFVNDKGHFLNREDALKYGIDSGLIDPQAGKFGALTSTLMADSSKPGTAIEAMAKTYPLAKPADRWTNTLGQNDHLIQNMSPDEFLNQSRPLKIDAESRETIDALKQHMKEGKQLDPLELHANGKEDGRHRAIAAKELGIGQVPVINYRPPAQPFYSALEHNVNAISQNKMNGEAWLGTLANKPGVKPEELDWTGLKSFLEENKGKPVTKEQVQEHLASNKVELKEVSKGNNPDLARWKELDSKAVKTPAERAEYENLSRNSPNIAPTKYHSYQLPGGENYREMLMTLPKKSEVANNNYIALQEKLKQKYGDKPWGQMPLTAEESRLMEKYISDYGDGPAAEDAYKSSHWDEPNILAHVRMNDRTIDGKKSLHLEEIQSDWHQQGRDKGYADPVIAKRVEQLKEERKAVHKKLVEAAKNDSPDFDKYHTQKKNISEEMDRLENSQNERLPDAPFKKTWHELALKRMLREAAEKGYDRLSWTPGEAQAARYDLSKSIGSLKATPIMDQHGLKYEIRATDPSGTQEVLNQVHTADELPNVVGKEMAKKIIDESEGKKPVNFKGLDLKVGGEGMKGFYDQIIPKALEKLGKEHGVRVKQAGVDVSGGKALNSRDHGGIFEDGVAQVHYIDIPQSLKDRAMHKGFPLFSSAYPSYSFTPVDGDPFKKDKK